MTLEQDFMKELMIALGARPGLRIHRQNTGGVEVYRRGRVIGYFEAGPPAGAADISGIVAPEGRRLEIETKGEKTKKQPGQDAWKAMIESHGGIYVRVRYNEQMTMRENVDAAVLATEEAIHRRRMT